MLTPSAISTRSRILHACTLNLAQCYALHNSVRRSLGASRQVIAVVVKARASLHLPQLNQLAMENYEFEDDEESGLQTLYHVFPYTRAASDLRSADYTTSCILFATRPGRKTVLLYAEAGKKLPRELDELASKVNSAAVNVTAKLTKSDSLPSFVSQLASILIDVEAYQVCHVTSALLQFSHALSFDQGVRYCRCGGSIRRVAVPG